MAGVKRPFSGSAIATLTCVALLGLIAFWMWFDFHYMHRSGGTDIGRAAAVMLLVLAVVIAFLGSCIAMIRRSVKGLPAFRLADSEMPSSDSSKLRRLADVTADPDDPIHQLVHPPPDALVTEHAGRRVVVLADGSAIGELRTGGARRFGSLDEFRSFVGS